MSQLGLTKEGRAGPGSVAVNRSHVIVEKGGRVLDVKSGLKGDESLPLVLKFLGTK